MASAVEPILRAGEHAGDAVADPHDRQNRRGFVRRDLEKPYLENHFCSTCGNLVCWRGLEPEADGRRRMAVNIRLAEPEAVTHLPIRPFDGLQTFEDLPSDGRCVRDLWC